MGDQIVALTNGQSQDWEEKARAKRKQQQESIPQEWATFPIKDDVTNVLGIPVSCGFLTETEIKITSTDVSVLLKNLSQGLWSSVEVTTAFCKRAVIAHRLVSANDDYHWVTFPLTNRRTA